MFNDLPGKKIIFDGQECCILLGIGTSHGDYKSKLGSNSIFIVGDYNVILPPKVNIKELYQAYTEIREEEDFMMMTILDFKQFETIHRATPFKSVSWSFADEFQPINDKPGMLTYVRTLYK